MSAYYSARNEKENPPSYQSKIISDPVIPQTTEEANHVINLPWMPPSPVRNSPDPDHFCRLSHIDANNIFDLLMANNTAFIAITLLALCFGFWCLYSLIIEAVRQLLYVHFEQLFNITKIEDNKI